MSNTTPTRSATLYAAGQPALNNHRTEVAFVLDNVANWQTLASGVRAGVEVVLLDSRGDGLAQMADWLAHYAPGSVDAIHILSHGSKGSLGLGSTTLDSASLQTRATELAQIGQSLTVTGDILLYGCDVAAGDTGAQFVGRLAQATAADVAASTDLTGAANKGGNWTLEYETGLVQSASPMSASGQDAFQGNLGVGDNDTFNMATFSGYGTKVATSAGTYGTLKVESTVRNLVDSVDTTGSSGELSTDFGVGTDETSVKFSENAGKTFDFGSITITNWDESETLVLTTSKGGTLSLVGDPGVPITFSHPGSNALFDGITWFTITETTVDALPADNGYALTFDEVVLNNITAPVVAPTVSSVTSSTADGSYNAGDAISIQVTFSEAVTVTGTPQLTLETGSTDRIATYAFNNGSGVLTFTYTVQAGDTSADLDYQSTAALAQNGGSTIVATTGGAAANLTLAALGAAGSLGGSKAIVIDTTAPTLTVGSVDISADTGTSNSDFLTKTASQTVTGTLSGTLAVGDILYGSVDNGGTWTNITNKVSSTAISWDGVTLSGSSTILFKITDAAGNDSATTGSQAYVLDTTAPTLTVGSVDISADTGTSNSDFLTKTASQTVTGTLSGTLAVGDVLYGSVDNGSTWTNITTKVSGTGISWDGATLSGSSTILFKITDAAGNDSATSGSQAYVLDTTGPAITFSALSFSADTGSNSTDFITKTTAQTIGATLSGAPAGTDIVYGSLDNGSTWIDITSKVSGTTLTWNGVTLTSSSTLKLKVTDSAGNDGTVTSQAYVLDTTAPSAPSTPDLTTGTDSGSSNSDDKTSDSTPDLTGTAVANSTVTLYDTDGSTSLGTATADGSGNWSITSSTLSEGTHTITAKATDAAGNVSNASSGLSVVIDTSVPTAGAPTVSGYNTSSGGTSHTFSITYADTGVGMDTSTFGTGNVTVKDGSNTSLTITGASASGNTVTYTITAPGGTWDTADAGTYTIGIVGNTVKDLAGNAVAANTSAATFVVGNNAAPTVTTPTAIALTDTAAADTFSNQTGTLSASDSDGMIASYGISTGTTGGTDNIGGVVYDISKVGTYGTLYVKSADGSYVYLPNATAINARSTDASETFTVTATDNLGAAGNATLTVNVTAANDTPTDISLSATTFNQSGGTDATVGNLTTTDVDTGQTHSYSLVSGTGDTNNNSFNINSGTLRANAPSALAAGTYSVLVRTSDNGTGGLTYDKAFTITVVDNVAPTVTSITRQTPSSSPTNSDSLTFRVTFNEPVTGIGTADFSVSGTTGTVASVTQVGSTNAYDVVVSGGDLASLNATVTLAFSGGQNITDTATAPNALTATTPTVTNNNTYLVDNAAPTLTGAVTIASNNTNTAQAKVGDTVTVTFTTDGTQSGLPTATIAGNAATVTNTGGNNYTATYTLVSGDTEGAVSFSIGATDATGNAMTAATATTNSSSVNFDKTAPTLAIGTVSGDDKINDTEDESSVTISGTSSGADGQTVSVSVAGGAAKTAIIASGGAWSVSLTSSEVKALTEGNVAITANVSDAAGNAATQAPKTVVYDRTAPTLAISTVSGDDKINDTEDESSVTISGTSTGADGQTVSVSVAGGAAKTATIASGGAWSVSLSSGEVKALTEGNVSITADVSDAAGNAATQAPKTVVYDRTAPTLAISTIATDDRINDTEDESSVTISGTSSGADGQTVSVSVAGGAAKTAIVASGGAWSVSLTSAEVKALTPGNVAITASVSDVAGNPATQATKTVVYDITAPVFNSAGSTPADNATNHGIGNDIVVKFGERIDASSNLTKVYLKDVATDTLVPATITLNADGNIVINPTGKLDYSKAYYVTWEANALKDLAGNAVTAVADETTYNFTTETYIEPPVEPPITVIDDGDGVSNAIESAVPGLPGAGGITVVGDGNGDGIADASQAGVSSTQFRVTETITTNPTATPTFVTLVADSLGGKTDPDTGNAQITSIVQKDAPANLPVGLKMPLGLIGFTAAVDSRGTAETFSLYVDANLGVNGYWKQNSAGTWVNLASEAFGGRMVNESGRLRLDFVIQDGGAFDADGQSNGVISDPGAAGFMPQSITEHHPKLPVVNHVDHFWF